MGLPEGNVFDYASTKLLQFETKWKAEQKKKLLLDKYRKKEVSQSVEKKTRSPKRNFTKRVPGDRKRKGGSPDANAPAEEGSDAKVAEGNEEQVSQKTGSDAKKATTGKKTK